MWNCSKKLLATGAILVFADARLPAQDPIVTLPAIPVPTPTSAENPPASPPTPPDPDLVEQLPPPNLARPATPSAACAAAPVGTGQQPRIRTHPPLLAHVPSQALPLGALMHDAFQTQVNNGIAAQMVL